MKRLMRNLLLVLTAAALFTCKRIQPGLGVVTIIDGSFSKASASFQFVDAKTGALLDVNGTENIKVAIYGKNAADVVDNLGGKNYGSASGFLAVALNEGVVPSTITPTVFTVHATANGYLPANQSVSLVQEGHRHFIVPMVKIANSPAGVGVKQGPLPQVAATGITAGSYTFSVDPVAGTATGATVNIPAGTKLMDNNNNAVSGSVSYTLASFNPTDNTARGSFPGGFDNAKTTDNKNVFFNTFGWIDLNIATAGGAEVKKFSQPIQSTIVIPDGARKVDGTLLAAGSTLQVYSYDEVLAVWKYETDAQIKQNAITGKLEASFEMMHLSTWQFTEAVSSRGATYQAVKAEENCPDNFETSTDIMVKQIINIPAINYQFALYQAERAVISFDKNKPIYLQSLSEMGANPSYYKYIYWRTDFPNDVVNYEPYKDGGTLKFPSSWCVSVPVKEFDIVLTTSCPDNPTRKIRPQCFVMAWEEGTDFGKFITLGQMTDGVIKTNTGVLKKGKRYAILAIYQSKFVVLTGKLGSLDFGFRLIDGNVIDLSRPLTSDECGYLRGKTG